MKISSDPYDFDRLLAMRGVLPQGAGLGNRSFATRSSWRTSSRPDSIFSARATIWCAAAAFEALAPKRAACSCSAVAFFSMLARSFLRRSSSATRWRR